MKRGFLNNPKKKPQKSIVAEKSDTAVVAPSPSRDRQIVAFVFNSDRNDQYNPNPILCRTVELSTNWSSTSVHPKALILSTIPSTPTDTYGTSQCVLYARNKLRLFNSPGFPCRPQSLPGYEPAQKPYEIKSTGSKGLGMFATCPLKVGDLIVLERPLVILPTNMDLIGVKDCPDIIRSKNQKSQMGPGPGTSVTGVIEATLVEMVKRMTKENKEAYLALESVHRNSAGLDLSSIWRTNMFELMSLDETEDCYSAVMKDMSRINHSCRPNCSHSFSPDSFTVELRATRAIAPGEEIVYSYSDPWNPVDYRQWFLKMGYGFSCSCASCVPTPTNPCNDTIRASMSSRMDALNNLCGEYAVSNKKDYEAAQNIYNACISLLRDMEQEGLDGYGGYSQVLKVCAYYCSVLTDIAKSTLAYRSKEKHWREEQSRLAGLSASVMLAIDGSYKVKKFFETF